MGYLKNVLESFLVRVPLGRLARSALHGDGLVLAYHNVRPTGAEPAGERALHLPEEVFCSQLDFLIEEAEVVPLMELASDRRTSLARPRVAITFDDAYRGAVQVGLGEVVRRRLPATVFVAPGCLGSTFWWDELADPAGGELSPHVRSRCLREWAGVGDRIRKELGGFRNRGLPRWCEAVTEEELAAACRLPGIELGAHSWSHPCLAQLGPADVAEELRRPLVWLRERFPNVIPSVAYPYGKLRTGDEQAVLNAGYLSGYEIAGGRIRLPPATPVRLPRLNVPAGLSMNGFALRVRGVCSR